MRPRRMISILLIMSGIVLIARSFVLVDKEVTVLPGNPEIIDLPATTRLCGSAEADSSRIMFQMMNESSYENGTSLMKTRWTKSFRFDVGMGGFERSRFVISNTNVDPTIQVKTKVRAYGLAPFSPWLLAGLCLIFAGVMILLKKGLWLQ